VQQWKERRAPESHITARFSWERLSGNVSYDPVFAIHSPPLNQHGTAIDSFLKLQQNHAVNDSKSWFPLNMKNESPDFPWTCNLSCNNYVLGNFSSSPPLLFVILAPRHQPSLLLFIVPDISASVALPMALYKYVYDYDRLFYC